MSNRALFVALCLLLSNPSAFAASIDSVLVSDTFAGPQGFQDMCQTHPVICADHLLDADLVHNDRLDKLLFDVHRHVNARIEAIVEPFGQDDWRLLPNYGDCEDFALTKYVLLRDAGLQPSDMRFAVTLTETGEYHAVLIVESERGSTVLDNRFDLPLPWATLRDSGYRWIAVQQRGKPGTWSLTSEGQRYAASLNGTKISSGSGR